MEDATLNGQWGLQSADTTGKSKIQKSNNIMSRIASRARTTGKHAANYTRQMFNGSESSGDDEDVSKEKIDVIEEADNQHVIVVQHHSGGNVYTNRQHSTMPRKRTNGAEKATDTFEYLSKADIHGVGVSHRNDHMDQLDGDHVYVERGRTWSDAHIRMRFRMANACQVCALTATVVLIFLLVCYALLTQSVWYAWNNDTLMTAYSHVMVIASQRSSNNVFSNSKQNDRNYVRYGNYTEFIVSSSDVLLQKDVGIFVNSAAKYNNDQVSASRLNDISAERNENNYVASYHQHLSVEPNVPDNHLNLVSLNTISKLQTNNETNVYGKLSIATYQSTTDSMFETTTFDASQIHLRSPSVFVNHDLFVGEQVYFGVHRRRTSSAVKSNLNRDTAGNSKRHASISEHTVYLPLLGTVVHDETNPTSVGNDSIPASIIVPKHEHYHANKVENDDANVDDYTMNVGNSDLQHVNIIAASSIVLGTYDSETNHYDLSVLHAPNATYVSAPLLLEEPMQRIYTDASFAEATSDENWHVQAGADALDKIKALPVHRFRSSLTQREHVSFLAQHIVSVLPEAVQQSESTVVPRIERHSGSATTSGPIRASDHRVLIERQSLQSVDTDTIVATLVMAVQEQQRTIDQLRTQLASLHSLDETKK